MWGIVLIISLTIHEFSHALAAYLQGDSTAERSGRLTLNPLSHLDPAGTLIYILLVLAHSPFIIGWAKPVPYNPMSLKNPRWGSVLVGFAGPLSNFIMFFTCALILQWAGSALPPSNLLVIFLAKLMLVNGGLGIFNLIPVAPLDGSKILYGFLPYKYSWIAEWLERYGFFILIALIILPIPILNYFLGYGFGALCFPLDISNAPIGCLDVFRLASY